MARAGRLALHIDVDGGRLIFDKRPGASHEECVSHDKSERAFIIIIKTHSPSCYL